MQQRKVRASRVDQEAFSQGVEDGKRQPLTVGRAIGE
jgi:hypothetical protein